MAEDGGEGARAAEALARFNQENNANGLFLRQGRGRLRRAGPRLLFALIGSVVFGILHDPDVGFLAAMVYLVGEVVEGAVLAGILARWSFARPVPQPVRCAACLAGALQALSTLGGIAILWLSGVGGDTRFLCIALLVGASMDAGATIRYSPRTARIRLAIYVVGSVGLTAHGLWGSNPAEAMAGRQGFDLVATLMLAVATALYIRFVARTHDRRMRDARTILEEQSRLVEAQCALEAKEREARRLALVARHASDGVIIYREDCTIDWVNETVTRMTGYASEELVGRRIEEALPASDLDPEGVAALVAARRDRRAYRGELMVRRKSGEILWIEANLTPIPASGGLPPMMIAVERDITEAKAREAELARARTDAEAAAKAKARFLATISHELRTPMNGVIGTAELLGETCLDADQRLYVDTIVQSGHALLTIINDVLDLSRIEAGRPVLVRAPVDLADCVRRAVDLLGPTARAKGIALDFEGPAATLPALVGDGGRIRQVVLNLVGNAIKFTDRGGVRVTLSARASEGGYVVALSVADTGIGIPPDRIGAIFDSFTQADDDISRRFGGTGLGLTISRRLAEEMGGAITVTSRPGEGSVFTMALSLPPAQDGEAAPEPAASPAPEVALPEPSASAPTARRRPRVLLAEDNRTNALIAQRMLAAEGLDILHAVDGRAATEIFARRPPDLVLMDLSMPVMNGFDALRAMRAIEADQGLRPIPIVALTASALDGDRAACLEAGFDGFLCKPVPKRELVAEVTRWRPRFPTDASGDDPSSRGHAATIRSDSAQHTAPASSGRLSTNAGVPL